MQDSYARIAAELSSVATAILAFFLVPFVWDNWLAEKSEQWWCGARRADQPRAPHRARERARFARDSALQAFGRIS